MTFGDSLFLTDPSIEKGTYYTFMIITMIAGFALSVYNFLKGGKSVLFFILGTVYVAMPACLYATHRNKLEFFPIPTIQVELACYFILLYLLPGIEKLRNGITAPLKYTLLFLASVYPVMLTMLININSQKFHQIFFVSSMGMVTLISLFYGFVNSKDKPIISKLFYFLFGIVAGVIEALIIIGLIMDVEKTDTQKFIAYVSLIMHCVFPVSCTLLLHVLKDTLEETNTLL